MAKEPHNTKDTTKDIEKRELTFLTCPIHKIPYPKGASCPQCSKDR